MDLFTKVMSLFKLKQPLIEPVEPANFLDDNPTRTYDKDLYEDLYTLVTNTEVKKVSFKYRHPKSGKELDYKLKSLGDEKAIQAAIKGLRRNNVDMKRQLSKFSERATRDNASFVDKRDYMNIHHNIWHGMNYEAVLLRRWLDHYSKKSVEELHMRQYAVSEIERNMASQFPIPDFPILDDQRRHCLEAAGTYAMDNYRSLQRLIPEFLQEASDHTHGRLSTEILASRSVVVDDVAQSSIDRDKTDTQGKHKRILESQDYYNALSIFHDPAGEDWELLWCPFSMQWHLRSEVKLAHIVPQKFGQEQACYMFGESQSAEIINSPRNFLLLHTDIEVFMDQGKIMFVPTAATEQQRDYDMQIVVLDESVLDVQVCRTTTKKVPRELTHNGRTVREFLKLNGGLLNFDPTYTNDAGQVITLDVKHRPGRRNMYFRTLMSLITAQKHGYKGWFAAIKDFRRTFYVTPGPWFRRSALQSLAKQANFPTILEAFTGYFGDSADSPALSRLQEEYNITSFLKLVERLAEEAGVSEAVEQEVEEDTTTPVDADVRQITADDVKKDHVRAITPTFVLNRPPSRVEGFSTPPVTPSMSSRQGEVSAQGTPAQISLATPGGRSSPFLRPSSVLEIRGSPSERSGLLPQGSPGQLSSRPGSAMYGPSTPGSPGDAPRRSGNVQGSSNLALPATPGSPKKGLQGLTSSAMSGIKRKTERIFSCNPSPKKAACISKAPREPDVNFDTTKDSEDEVNG